MKHPGLISFRMDWLDLLAVQETLKSLLQHHSSKESIFQCSAFFTVQLSHPYMTTGKTKAFIRQTFVGKVIPFAYSVLYPLVLKKYNHESDYMLNPMSSSESLNLVVMLGTSGTPELDSGKKQQQQKNESINVNVGKITFIFQVK